jgi:two-component system, chemotaxis family, CheB/CheR fusion protein
MPNLNPNQPSLVVGIGASAGGLTAFKSFLSTLQPDTGMAFVLVQHLAPNHKSLLVELLSAQSPIPVAVASDGLEVKKDCIYVIPPDATLTIKDEVLQLQSPAPTREHRRPIDSFFASLAEDCGERAVGIVLAGVGSDGTLGIRAIREHGGLTLAQAEFDHHAMSGMPHSAAVSGMVDHVLPVEAMPAKLTAFCKHLDQAATKKDGNGHRRDIQEHLAKITSMLHARSTHDFSGYKEATLMRRLQRRMQVLHIDTAEVYLERLRTDQSEVGALFCELLIGVTQFFRDPEAFNALNALAIGPLLDAKGDDEPVRVWVPGCSTGEEVYSIAILLREALRARSRNPEVKIFGTDIDANAIATARRARYRKADVGLSPERLDQWFVKVEDDITPRQDLRDMCVFSVHSLVKDPPFSRLDLISCRNVMIYLEDDLQDRLMRTFHYGLQPGGTLFLGTAESVTRNSRLFTAIDKKNRILQRREVGQTTMPALQSMGSLLPSEARRIPSMRRRATDDKIDKAVGRLMQQYAPAYFVLDHNQEVVRFSGAETGHYLEPSQGPASFNLFSILHKSLRSVTRAAVRQAVAEGQRVVDDTLTIRIDGRVRPLTLIVEPIGGGIDAKAGGSCVVAFRDTSIVADAADHVSPDRGNADVQMLERELHGTKAQLQAATDDLETQLEDMKSTTEEFQAVNEELQSSNEELETSKEEMQSINEELQTINGELGSKNEQLLRLNADMQNLLDSTQIATVFLDEQLRIRHFTPALTELFSVRDADRGRPLTHFVSELDYGSVQADVETVLRDGHVIERDLSLKDSTKSFVMRIQPYRASQNVVDGVVFTFVDITERKQNEARLAMVSGELQHRSKNLLAVIGSIANRTLSAGRTIDDARTAFVDRLKALGNANELLSRLDWRGATMKNVVERALEPFGARFSIEGERVLLNPNATQGFMLVLHELGTNAHKHGAFSTTDGTVVINWSIRANGGGGRQI